MVRDPVVGEDSAVKCIDGSFDGAVASQAFKKARVVHHELLLLR
jgi:hypothetical protein